MAIEPRHYQKAAVDSAIDYLSDSPNKNPLIAMPTGSGKSVVLSELIKTIIGLWGDVNILVLSHVKEILDQDEKAIRRHLNIDTGVYSSGLERKEIKQVTVAGVQSACKNTDLFSHFDFVMIDECHLISEKDDSMYRKLLSAIGCVFLGLTASPFRLGTGYIYGTEESLFDDLIYDLTSMGSFNRLVDEGFLCNLRTKSPDFEMDDSKLHKRGGEFIDSEMSKMFDRPHITSKALDEVCQIGGDYGKWLVFAIDIEHAENIAENLNNRGIKTKAIHSKMDESRDDVIDDYKKGELRCVVNVNVLTTGFDDPEIDLIVLLRLTNSPVFHVQTIGRGLRVCEGKHHCMILDFAGNTKRLGPINNIVIKKKGKGKANGEPITKTCPSCNAIHHPSVRKCDHCGHEFVFAVNIFASSGGDEVVQSNSQWYGVNETTYTIHKKKNTPDMVKVSYYCGLRVFSEYWCFDHGGYARRIAIKKVSQRLINACGTLYTTKNILSKKDTLHNPKRIFVDHSGKHKEVLKYDFQK